LPLVYKMETKPLYIRLKFKHSSVIMILYCSYCGDSNISSNRLKYISKPESIYCNYIRIFQHIVNILYNAVFFHETPILIGWRQIFAGINSTIDAVKMFAHPQTIHHVMILYCSYCGDSNISSNRLKYISKPESVTKYVRH
jgi:hypothetical protein